MRKNRKTNDRRFFNRYTALLLVMLLIMGLITRTLFDMQIVNGEAFQDQADAYSIKDIMEPAPRGEILDREGEVLASNLASYDVMYNETRESTAQFYDIMKEYFRLLEGTGEKLHDTFELKVEPEFSFDFNTANPEALRYRELRFKKDRNMNDWILDSGYGKMIGKSRTRDLTDEESRELDSMLLAVSPEETFNYLIRYHRLYNILDPTEEERDVLLELSDEELAKAVTDVVPAAELRKYMLVRDQVRMKLYQSNKSVPLAKSIKKESAFVFMQRSNMLAGIDVQLNPTRVYPYGTLASHVLGYMSNISEYNRERYESMGYDINQDMIGVYGIESAYETDLKGNKSVSTVKVDSQGRTINELFRLEGYPGSTVQLTLDKDLQYTAEKALADTLENLRTNFVEHEQGKSNNATRGAVVAVDVHTGKVLAMASFPDFDPNVFIVPDALTPELYEEYFDPDLEKFGAELIRNLPIPGKTLDDIFPRDANGNRTDYYDNYPKPFLNYATQGLSPVGSVFKPFTALAALENGMVDGSTIMNDTGVYERPELPGYRASNNNEKPYGLLDITDALKVSSNVFFLELGWRLSQAVGLDGIAETAWDLGLGHDPTEELHSTTGIETNENVYGNVFNFTSRKRIMAHYAYSDMVRILRNGVARDGSRFKALDVSKKDTDSERVKQLKQEMDEGLSKYWNDTPLEDTRSIDEKFDEIRQILDYNLDAIIQELPAEEQEGMADSAYLADQVANVLIFDRGTELTSSINVLNASIGQGDAQLTILQLANALATMANGGTRYRTSLVDRIIDPEGNVTKVIEPEVVQELGLDPANLDLIFEGMWKVNNEEGGSGYRYMREMPISTAGKTGTAQFSADSSENYVGRHQYGTYIAFAPYEEPEIAIAVIGYDAIHGSYMAPVARAIIEEYFEEEIAGIDPTYRRTFDYELKPVMAVEPSLLKLNEPDEVATTPVTDTYVPGEPVPVYMNQPVNTRADGTVPLRRASTPLKPEVEAEDPAGEPEDVDQDVGD